MQAWIPTFLNSLGAGIDLQTLGVLSALPWLCTALVGSGAGKLADWLQTAQKWPALRVRHCMHTASSAIGCVSLSPLVFSPVGALSPVTATAALCCAIAAQGFNYGGYHAYVQDVAPQDAGLILGLTNTCSSLSGIVGNLVTSAVAGGPGGFSAVFAVVMVLHAVSMVTWLLFARGKQIRLTSC